jgi:hypothetical protein
VSYAELLPGVTGPVVGPVVGSVELVGVEDVCVNEVPVVPDVVGRSFPPLQPASRTTKTIASGIA